MSQSSDLGKLLLRFGIGVLMLMHGIDKLRHGIGGIIDGVHGHGLPTFVAYGVYFGEVAAPLLLIFGLWSRLAGLVFAFNMVVAVWLAHSGDVLKIKHGYALELQALYFVGGLCVALLGAGQYSVSRGVGRFD